MNFRQSAIQCREKTVKCRKTDIKELLPAYLEHGLGNTSLALVEDHLKTCEDCRDELSLLSMLGEETVPDPGEAFWDALPGRVYREVQAGASGKKTFGFARLFDLAPAPRWAWATTALAITAMLSFIIFRPSHPELARTVPPDTSMVFDDFVSVGPVNVAELSSSELIAAARWAQNAFAPVRDAIGEDGADARERDLSEDLSNLSPEELDRLSEMIKIKEQEAREKLRIKTSNEKGLV